MTAKLPPAIMQLIRASSLNKDNAKAILRQVVEGIIDNYKSIPRTGKVYDDTINHNVNIIVDDFHGQCNQLQNSQLNLTQPKPKIRRIKTPSSSPHAPVSGRKKLPYWLKVVTSIDPKVKNGYGIKGKFISINDMKTVPDDKYVVACIKHDGDSIYQILKSHPTMGHFLAYPSKTGITVKEEVVPNAQPYTLPIHNINDLFWQLKMVGIPDTP